MRKGGREGGREIKAGRKVDEGREERKKGDGRGEG